MRISLNWLSEIVELKSLESPQQLADLLTERGLEAEEVLPLAQGLENVITAQVMEKKQHPQADRLSLCQVSTGKGEPVQIVCGAQNFKQGDKVALAQIGAQLPNGLKIKESKIRGEASFGMLCSEEELKFAETSEGIIVLPQDTPLGIPLAQALQLDDVVLVLGITTNRGDCLSHLGVAREAAAALESKVRLPKVHSLSYKDSPISVHLEAGEEAPQFFGCFIEGVSIGPSPKWVVSRLEALGSRSINNVVDASNLLMLELGHPVHAYDADLIEGGQIGVRKGRAGEELRLLDDSNVKLDGTELVIFDGKKSVGLAGVMGGGNSEVRDSTTRVFLECAEFAPLSVRKTALKFQKRTDAAIRFEKGVDPLGLGFVLERFTQLVLELAGGKVIGSTRAQSPSRQKYESPKIEIDPAYFSRLLGMEIPPASAKKSLEALGCKVSESRKWWEVVPPSYRWDLRIPEDLVEEVARSVGYQKIPSTVPVLTSQPESQLANPEEELKGRARSAMLEAGMLEVVNYSFTSKGWLKRFGMVPEIKVLNPLSEEQEWMVPSLIPGLVKNALDNWHHHFGSEPLPIRLFELRPVFRSEGEVRAATETQTGAIEDWKLAFALSGPRYASALRNERGEVDFYDVKGLAEFLFEELGTRGVRILPLADSRKASEVVKKLFHPGKSAEIWIGRDVVGYVGAIHPGLAASLKIRHPLWIGELDWSGIEKLSRTVAQPRMYRPWSEFPPMERDFALLVKEDVSADKITQVALKAGQPIAKVAKIFDIYRGSQVAQGMTSVAVRVIFFGEGRSLQEAETEAASSKILAAWKKELGADLR